MVNPVNELQAFERRSKSQNCEPCQCTWPASDRRRVRRGEGVCQRAAFLLVGCQGPETLAQFGHDLGPIKRVGRASAKTACRPRARRRCADPDRAGRAARGRSRLRSRRGPRSTDRGLTEGRRRRACRPRGPIRSPSLQACAPLAVAICSRSAGVRRGASWPTPRWSAEASLTSCSSS
jgi:hypothetical protein